MAAPFSKDTPNLVGTWNLVREFTLRELDGGNNRDHRTESFPTTPTKSSPWYESAPRYSLEIKGTKCNQQGVPWVVRQVLRYANLSLKIKQAISLPDGTTAEVTDDNPSFDPPADAITTLCIKQTVYPGGFDSEGTYPVDGKPQDVALPIFGDVMVQLRYMNVAEIPDETLRQKLGEASPSKTLIDEVSYNPSKCWEARVKWGFELIDRTRYLTRNVTTTKDRHTANARMVYDYHI